MYNYYNNDKYFLVLVVYLFVMFYFFFVQKAKNNRFKKPVCQNFPIFLLRFLLKVGLFGLVDQQIYFFLP